MLTTCKVKQLQARCSVLCHLWLTQYQLQVKIA
jgi:hypothetical protein